MKIFEGWENDRSRCEFGDLMSLLGVKVVEGLHMWQLAWFFVAVTRVGGRFFGCNTLNQWTNLNHQVISENIYNLFRILFCGYDSTLFRIHIHELVTVHLPSLKLTCSSLKNAWCFSYDRGFLLVVLGPCSGKITVGFGECIETTKLFQGIDPALPFHHGSHSMHRQASMRTMILYLRVLRGRAGSQGQHEDE